MKVPKIKSKDIQNVYNSTLLEARWSLAKRRENVKLSAPGQFMKAVRRNRLRPKMHPTMHVELACVLVLLADRGEKLCKAVWLTLNPVEFIYS